MLIVGTNFGLLSLDKKDGHELWQSETNDSFDAKPIIINDMLYARATNTSMIYAISPADGRYLGYLKLGESSLLGISHPEYDILYQTGEFLIFPFENTVYAYQ
jgi:outer membrane protein assembly factor BamB